MELASAFEALYRKNQIWKQVALELMTSAFEALHQKNRKLMKPVGWVVLEHKSQILKTKGSLGGQVSVVFVVTGRYQMNRKSKTKLRKN
jgi:hypothetical protein